MKTPQELDKIYNRLPQEKTELSVEKVELSLIKELLTIHSALLKVQDEIDNNLSKSIKLAIRGDIGINKFKKKFTSAESLAKELGIAVSNTALQKLISDIDKLEKSFKKVQGL
jgi:predicted transcriptional regulator